MPAAKNKRPVMVAPKTADQTRIGQSREARASTGTVSSHGSVAMLPAKSSTAAQLVHILAALR